jgi:hypothetical protein
LLSSHERAVNIGEVPAKFLNRKFEIVGAVYDRAFLRIWESWRRMPKNGRSQTAPTISDLGLHDLKKMRRRTGGAATQREHNKGSEVKFQRELENAGISALIEFART